MLAHPSRGEVLLRLHEHVRVLVASLKIILYFPFSKAFETQFFVRGAKRAWFQKGQWQYEILPLSANVTFVRGPSATCE